MSTQTSTLSGYEVCAIAGGTIGMSNAMMTIDRDPARMRSRNHVVEESEVSSGVARSTAIELTSLAFVRLQ